MSNTLHIAISTHNLTDILLLGFLGFVLSMLITPIYTTVAYRRQWWKRPRTDAWSGGKATVYQQLHAQFFEEPPTAGQTDGTVQQELSPAVHAGDSAVAFDIHNVIEQANRAGA